MSFPRTWTNRPLWGFALSGCLVAACAAPEAQEHDAAVDPPEAGSTIGPEAGISPSVDGSVWGDAEASTSLATDASTTVANTSHASNDADVGQTLTQAGSLTSAPDAATEGHVTDSFAHSSSDTNSSQPGQSSGSDVVTSEGSSDETQTASGMTTSDSPGCDGGVCRLVDAAIVDASPDAGPGAESCPPSCILDLFTACVPSGQDECLTYNNEETICWPNGAYQKMAGGLNGASATLNRANGDVCMSTLTERQEDNSFEVEWRNGEGDLAASGVEYPDGSFTITCAGESTSHEIDVYTDCSPFYLPFLDSYLCDYGDDTPPAGTCGN